MLARVMSESNLVKVKAGLTNTPGPPGPDDDNH
jgi:hypothetical protein